MPFSSSQNVPPTGDKLVETRHTGADGRWSSTASIVALSLRDFVRCMSPEVAHNADDGRRPGRPVTGVHLPSRQSGSAGFQKRASGISLCLRFRLQQGRDFLDDCNVLLSHFAHVPQIRIKRPPSPSEGDDEISHQTEAEGEAHAQYSRRLEGPSRPFGLQR